MAGDWGRKLPALPTIQRQEGAQWASDCFSNAVGERSPARTAGTGHCWDAQRTTASPPGWHSRGLKEPWWSPPDSEKEKKGGESSPLALSYSWIETAFTFTPLTVRHWPRGCRRGTPGSQPAPASRVSSTLHRRVPPAAGVAGGPGRLPGFSSETGESGKPTPVSERRLPQGPSPPTHHPRRVGRSQS